ncbi:MAG TPA: helix-turn-helix domain-containing protein [Gemmatimonadaceae bacterium]|nr:helix-turn-helix domain-containing protein [Gemmatimonadaceae bacterium]
MIAALVIDREARARVRDATRGMGDLRFVSTVAELEEVLPVERPDAVVLEPVDSSGMPTAALAERLREGYPSLPIIAYAMLTPGGSQGILSLARAGVHELVIRGFDDLGLAMRAALARAREQAAAAFVMRELESEIPPAMRPLIRHCLERGAQTQTVAGLARTLGVHRKTLVNRSRDAGFPTPSLLIGWCRLLLAARLLEDPARSIEHVALALDFPSATALRNMLRRYAGLSPSEVRERGGLRCVLETLRHVLRDPHPKRQGARTRRNLKRQAS